MTTQTSTQIAKALHALVTDGFGHSHTANNGTVLTVMHLDDDMSVRVDTEHVPVASGSYVMTRTTDGTLFAVKAPNNIQAVMAFQAMKGM